MIRNFARLGYFCDPLKTVAVAQLVRVVVCGTTGRGFEPHQPPLKSSLQEGGFFYWRRFLFCGVWRSKSFG